jgi:hypothetical protein
LVSVHLYGKLRRFAVESDPRSESVVVAEWKEGQTVADVVAEIGIPADELGSNIFVNGRYAALASPVPDGARLGLFPDDMQLLYKWYFAPSSGSASPNLSTEEPTSGPGRSESGGEERKK